MADKSIISNEKLAAIAQAIKAKDATATLPMTVDEMAAAIAAIPTGGGGGTDLLTLRAAEEPYTYTNDEIVMVPGYAFYMDKCLEEINLGSAIEIYDCAFDGCVSLQELNAPQLESLYAYALRYCIGLTHLDMDNIIAIYESCFGADGPETVPGITEFVLPACENIFDYAFCGNMDDPTASYWPMSKLDIGTEGVNRSASIGTGALFALDAWAGENGDSGTLIIRFNRVATLSSDSLSNYPNIVVYVPDSLVSSYQAARGWSDAPDQIKGLSELPA